MSREQWWAKLSGSASSCNRNDISAFRKQFKHEPLAPRTSDPEALFLDEAYEIFFNGLKLAREGDLSAGCAQIACAFLLDDRSINFVLTLPSGSHEMVEEVKLLVIDLETMYKMIHLDLQGFGSMVLRIYLGIRLGNTPHEGQTIIAEALRCTEAMLSIIEMQPEIEDEDRGILGGCCTRKRLLYLHSTLKMSMGNHKNAIKDLTRALKIDPKYTSARCARVSLWSGMKLKDDTTIHREYETIANEYHQDNRGMEVIYAWLAITTFKDAKLGTYEDARKYYEKSIRASARRDELYGKRKKEQQEPPVLSILRTQYASLHANPNALKLRKDLDSVQQRQRGANEAEIKGDSSTSNLKHSCLKCGSKQKKNGGGKLMKCARCQSVSYCSRECQRADWKEHKVYCKIAAQPKQELPIEGFSVVTGGLKEISLNEPTKEDITPKEPIGEIQARSQATWRLLCALKELDGKFGKSFSSWWHGMNTKERRAILLKVTNSTLPNRKPSPSEIKRNLSLNGSSGSVMFDYNVERLIGKCQCPSATCRHFHSDVILHEIYEWVHKTEDREEAQWQQICEMYRTGIFPSQFEGTLAIMVPELGNWEMGEPLVFTDNCPKDVLDEYKAHLMEGHVYDANIGLYTIFQRYQALGLLVKLYDEFQQKVRRMISTYPFEAIMGCGHCKQSCAGDSAICCKTCEVAWFCCRGCMVAAGHVRCPIGRSSDACILFM